MSAESNNKNVELVFFYAVALFFFYYFIFMTFYESVGLQWLKNIKSWPIS